MTVSGVMPPVVLTINCSDPTGCVGTQADLKTFAAHRVYGTSVVTGADSTSDIYPFPGTVVGGQLSLALAHGAPVACKVGAVGTAENAAAIAARARAGDLPNLVLDPVLDAAGGYRRGVVAAMLGLLPHASVVTPNVDEAAALVGWDVSSTADMAGAAAQLAARGAKYVVITGGRLSGDECVDAIWTNSGVRFLHATRIATAGARGAGATFSAAIAARLAHGMDVGDAVTSAKEYVSTVLTSSCKPMSALPVGGRVVASAAA